MIIKKTKRGFIPLETLSRKLGELSNAKELCRRKSLTGFTLLEILLVVGIIAILAGIIIIAINPGKQLASVRNVQRKANLAEINKALYQYYIDNSRYPVSVTSTLTEICNTGATTTGHSLNCTGLADLSYLVPTYLVSVPTDPQSTASSTKYSVMKDTANKIALSATQAELSTTVSLGNVPAPWACGTDITDVRDSKVYTTVLIGTQCWMKKNINYGTLLAGASDQTNNSIAEKYCYNNDENNCTANGYGGLYQWAEAMNYSTTPGVQGICPTGWHIPTDTEYKTLEMQLGMSQAQADASLRRGTTEGTKLKVGGSSGFEAIITGIRDELPSFRDVNNFTIIWTSTQYNFGSSWYRSLLTASDQVERDIVNKIAGFSVRCVKN